MEGHDVVVVGASAGGVEALGQVMRGLPAGLPAAVLVVLHLSPDAPSALPAVLSRRGVLPAAHAVHGEPLEHGRVYVAPPDRHLLVGDGRVQLALGPRENGHRPAVDPLFRTAAAAYGPRVTGVVLSGALDDGSAGLVAVKRRGGAALVQDPDDALAAGMPRSAIETVEVDAVLPAGAIGAVVARLAKEPAVGPAAPVTEEMAMETGMEALRESTLHADDRPGRPSGFSCPDCGGVLWELDDGKLVRFRCRTGHAWSGGSLLGQQVEALESSLWVALRSLEERAALAHKLRDGARERGHDLSARRFQEQADNAEQAASRIRDFLAGRNVQRQPAEAADPAAGEPAAGS